ncbi:MAG TPA: hypothetical protein VGZ51_09475, partial [Actinomycetota bacterium]|nr:hypothetical protein [Actinomycetota bacterium]
MGPWYSALSVDLTPNTGDDGMGSGVNAGTAVIEREEGTLTDGSCASWTGTWTTVSDPDNSVASGKCYRYRLRVSDNVGNVSANSALSTVAKVDTSAPGAAGLTLSENPADADQHVSGTKIFYRPGGGGSFLVAASASDAQSGVKHVGFPSVSGVSGGGVNDAASPYEETYTWNASTSGAPSGSATVTNNTDLTGAGASFELEADSTAPTGHSVALAGGTGWYSALSVDLTIDSGGDGTGSGVNAGSVVIERDEAPLVDGVCDPFPGTYAATVSDPDNPVQSGKCYRYRVRVADNVGNVSANSAASANAKIDTTAPGAPSLTLSENPADADQHVSGNKVFYRPGQAGSFKVAASASDGQSGIKHVGFPAISNVTGGGNDSSSPYEDTYSFGASTSGSHNQSVTATNNTDLPSGGAAFDLEADSTAPTSHSVGLNSGPWYSTLSVDLVPNYGNDGTGSGVDTSSAVIEREEATLTNGSCGSWTGTWTTVSDPDNTVQSGKCYRYRLRVADNVANVSAESAPSAEARVDASAPGAPSLTLSENPADADQHVSGNKVFYRPGQAGSFKVAASASDGQS